MIDVLFFIALVIGVMAAQIAVEIFKGYIQLKFAKKQTEVVIDAAFAKVGNFGLQSLMQRLKGGGHDEV
jgi:hypothetical protein